MSLYNNDNDICGTFGRLYELLEQICNFFSGNGFYKYQKQTIKHEIKILSTKT